MRKVIKIKFKDTGKTYYFGSYTAIFDRFTHEEIGAVINSVWNVTSKNNGRYENKKVVITRGFVETSQKRAAATRKR